MNWLKDFFNYEQSIQEYKYMSQLRIFITYKFPGIHYWNDVTGRAKHEYLRYAHRHNFHVKLTLSVNHDDRDFEFLEIQALLKQTINEIFPYNYELNLNDCKTYSCERMAQLIHEFLWGKDIHAVTEIEVSEDGENGAVVTY